MLTIAPPPCSRIKGTAALVQRNGPVRLTSSTRLQSASEVSSSGANTAIPALLTSASSRPKRRSISANALAPRWHRRRRNAAPAYCRQRPAPPRSSTAIRPGCRAAPRASPRREIFAHRQPDAARGAGHQRDFLRGRGHGRIRLRLMNSSAAIAGAVAMREARVSIGRAFRATSELILQAMSDAAKPRSSCLRGAGCPTGLPNQNRNGA